MEVHLVHKNSAGELAVVGVMIQPGTEHAELSKLVPHVPGESGPPVALDDVLINASALLPADLTSYRYSGSLTTPPCSEDVGWIVLRTPIEASQAQIDAFTAAVSGNNRPLQELHGREILMGK
jgi:carbonic anhydrase